jgi:metallo-beta-lactamase family protein
VEPQDSHLPEGAETAPGEDVITSKTAVPVQGTRRKRASPTVTFWGAAGSVTGSMHLVDLGRRKLLLDCGLFQGPRAETYERNEHFPFPPEVVDAVVLSHAHVDHCGNLPNLVRQGFRGPIYCTPATKDLTAIMLADSAKIQEEDADYLNRRRKPGDPPVEPLYRRADAHRAAGLFQPVPYDRPFDTRLGVELTFVDAGHLLGSAMVHLRFRAGRRTRSLTYTGDVGRRGLPILRDPAPVPPADLLISECTYGGKVHEPSELLAGSLGEVVGRTAQRGGKLLVPAFSLGRTQTVVYFLEQLVARGLLPPLPVFVDSPLAADATEVYRLHPECFNEETAELLEDHPDLFGRGHVRYTLTVQESKALNDFKGPCVIIAASGMCESGRIVHHLKHNIEDPRSTVLVVGFQAPETLGRRLVEGASEVRIHDRTYPVRAEVVAMNGFSSHADHQDFLAFLGPLARRVEHVRLVHGEPPQAEALAQALREQGFADVAIPGRGEKVGVD